MACIRGCETEAEREKAQVEDIEKCSGCPHQKMDGGILICTLSGRG